MIAERGISRAEADASSMKTRRWEVRARREDLKGRSSAGRSEPSDSRSTPGRR
jgi:hypothetical protein